MRIEPKAFGYAAGVTAALLSTVCAAFVALAPATAATLFGFVVHMDVSSLEPRVTWTAFLTGLLFWSVFVGLAFAFAAWLYDRLERRTIMRPLIEPLGFGG